MSENNIMITDKDKPSFCRGHSLNNLLFNALYLISQVLSRSLAHQDSLKRILEILNEDAGLQHGLITVLDSKKRALIIHTAQDELTEEDAQVNFLPGEGLLGFMLENPRTIKITKLSDDSRFLNRLGVFDPDLPFISVPIKFDSSLRGVLSVQPENCDDGLLDDRAQFAEMIANLLGRSLCLSTEVAEEKTSISEERDALKRRVRSLSTFENLVGRSSEMRRILEQARLVSKWNTTVLIRGETGTGKELIANAIHFNSPRSRNSFVKLNCAALPETLLESELFGHEKGAFTGALDARKGRFEQADGGTLFLDEIGDVSPAFQAKLLRVLQEGEFERVGGSKTIKVDVRIIAATHRNLEIAVNEGKFREDLYFRLNVMPIEIPPLRERIEDIPDISIQLIQRISKSQGRSLKIMDSTIRTLARHDWPGNVRELENCLERAAVLSEDGVITPDLIRYQASKGQYLERSPAQTGQIRADSGNSDLSERERVIMALEQAGWVQAKAARLLNMTPRQIAYRIQILNIEMKQI